MVIITKYFFYPEKMVDWYGEYIAIYTTSRTSLYDIAILDKDLKNIYGNNSPDVQNWIGYIERSNYISLSVKEYGLYSRQYCKLCGYIKI